MTRAGGLVVLIAVIAAIAGCTAADPPPGPIVSPAPVPADTRTPGGDRPPGITDDGVRWPHVLIRAHVGTLRQTSFTVESVRTVNSTGPLSRTRSVMVGRFAANKSRYHQTFVKRGGANPTGVRTELFADGEQLFEAIGTGPDRRYYRPRSELHSPPRPESFLGNPTQDDVIFIGIKAMETRIVTGSSTNGTRHVGLTGSRAKRPDLLSVGTLGTPVDHIKDPTLRVTVGDDGVVRTYHLRFTAVRGNETLWINDTVTFSRVGSTTVTPPAWYPEASRQLSDAGNATSM